MVLRRQDCLRQVAPGVCSYQQPTEGQRIGDEIKAAFVAVRSNCVSVHIILCETPQQAS
jgi:hypothetical protein